MVGGEMPSQGFALTRMKHPPFDFITTTEQLHAYRDRDHPTPRIGAMRVLAATRDRLATP